MSLTALQIRDDLLAYAGIDSADQAPLVIRKRVFNDVNSALQDIYTLGPAFLREKSFSFVLSAPQSLTGKSLTQWSTIMSGGTTVSEEMIGCTFRVDGEESDNEIVDDSTLQNPYQGSTTSSGSGTVFSDCIILPEDVASISGPIWLNQRYQLKALDGRNDFLKLISGNRRLDTGLPKYYWIETYENQQRLRLYPMPENTCILRVDAQLKAPQLDWAEFWPEVTTETTPNIIINQPLTGLDTSTGEEISATDTILQAFGKLGNWVSTLWSRKNHASTHVTGGDDIIADAVASGNSGLMSGSDKAKLDGMEASSNNYSHPNHTGDVTSTGDGATSISNNVVTNAKLSDMASNTIKGNDAGSSADPKDLTAEETRLLLSIREQLKTDRDYYVRTDGSDSNDGLTNDSSGAFLTIQKAVDVAQTLDIADHQVNINVADGTYTDAVELKSPMGNGYVYIVGNTANPENCIISTTSDNCFSASNQHGNFKIKGFKLQTTSSGYALTVNDASIDFEGLDFGACASCHMKAANNGRISCSGDYSISDDVAYYHLYCKQMGRVEIVNSSVMISGELSWSRFLLINALSNVAISNMAFVGDITSGTPVSGTVYRIGSAEGGADFTSCGASDNNAGTEFTANGSSPTWGTGGANLFIVPTGRRYDISQNSVVTGTSGSATYFPGSIAGITSTGGIYA